MRRTLQAQFRSPVRVAKPQPEPARSARNTTGMPLRMISSRPALNSFPLAVDRNLRVVHAMAKPNFLSVVHELLIPITLEANLVLSLKQLLQEACGGLAVLIRTEPVARSNKIRVYLSLSKTVMDRVMHTVICGLPSAEFGRVTSA